MSARRFTKKNFFKRAPTTREVEVEAYDGNVYRGSYEVERGTMTVRASHDKFASAECRGTDENCLARTLLLTLNGKPRMSWPDGWRPAGCPDYF